MMADGSRSRLAEMRRNKMIQSAQRYAWWLGGTSSFIRKWISLTGWNLSRRLYATLGRPAGALAWPLGRIAIVRKMSSCCG